MPSGWLGATGACPMGRTALIAGAWFVVWMIIGAVAAALLAPKPRSRNQRHLLRNFQRRVLRSNHELCLAVDYAPNPRPLDGPRRGRRGVVVLVLRRIFTSAPQFSSVNSSQFLGTPCSSATLVGKEAIMGNRVVLFLTFWLALWIAVGAGIGALIGTPGTGAVDGFCSRSSRPSCGHGSCPPRSTSGWTVAAPRSDLSELTPTAN